MSGLVRVSVLVVATALALAGCGGYGLLQTAKVRPEGDSGLVVAGLAVRNRVAQPISAEEEAYGSSTGSDAAETEDATWKMLGPEVDYRVHAANHLDLGIGTYLIGGRVDAKYDLAEPADKWGVAPRLGGGMGVSGDMSDAIAYGGVLGSYEPIKALGLYGGATFLNHWIKKNKPSWAKLAAGEREAGASGWGDGVVQLTAGLALGPRAKATFYVEYSLWEPMQDNPGDYFRFARSQLVAIGMGF